jgi:hypothetical protein
MIWERQVIGPLADFNRVDRACEKLQAGFQPSELALRATGYDVGAADR